MKELFNEEFYANEDDTKPTFSDSDIEFENCDNESKRVLINFKYLFYMKSLKD